jgi:hypothetical protein
MDNIKNLTEELTDTIKGYQQDYSKSSILKEKVSQMVDEMNEFEGSLEEEKRCANYSDINEFKLEAHHVI